MKPNKKTHPYQIFIVMGGLIITVSGNTPSRSAGMKVNKYKKAKKLAGRLTPESSPMATPMPSQKAMNSTPAR